MNTNKKHIRELKRKRRRVSLNRKKIDFEQNMYSSNIKFKIIPHRDTKTIWLEIFIRGVKGFFVKNICDIVSGQNNQVTHYKAGYLTYALPEADNKTLPAKTILTQGMNGTPEDIFLKKNRIPYAQKHNILKSLKDTVNYESTVKTMNFEAWKFFHKNGIVQFV